MNEHGVEKGRKTLARAKVLEYFAQLPPCLIRIEACGSAHYWARELVKLGHTVKLMAAQHVAAYRKRGKNDANDAEAICEAVGRPNMRFVAIKSEEQQAVLMVHRPRTLMMANRTAQVNQMRGLLGEFGVVVPKGWRALLAQVVPLLADETRRAVPELIRGQLLTQLEGLRALTRRVTELERQIACWERRERECQRIAAVPGVGKLPATAVIATVGDARAYRSGREFAAWLGIVPRQSGTGGRIKLLGISKRGDPYLRTLLIHGARTVLTQQSRADRQLDPWLKGLLSRRPKNVVIVALANKMARTIWALLAQGREFDRCWSRASMPAPALS